MLLLLPDILSLSQCVSHKMVKSPSRDLNAPRNSVDTTSLASAGALSKRSVRTPTPSKSTLSVPVSLSGKRQASASKTSVGSGGSFGSSGGGSGGSIEDLASRKRENPNRNKGKTHLFTHLWASIAESDVFAERHLQPAHILYILLSVYSIPVFTLVLLYDTLCVTVFQSPHLSTINFPGFAIVFQFVAIVFAMYGFCVQYVVEGRNARFVKLAQIALIIHLILFYWRMLLEVFFDGYRYQDKTYVPRTDTDSK